jgi:cell division protein ZipA
MDSESLRLILLGLGIALVVGIYLWDRYKRTARRFPKIKMDRKLVEPDFDLPERDDDVGEVRVRRSAEPYIDEPEQSVDEATERFSAEASESGDASVEAPAALNEWDRTADQKEPQFTLDFDEFNAHGDSDYLNIDPALLDEVPRKIVQISIMARSEPFSADQLFKAIGEVDLKYGDMNIYHRHTDSGQTLFSMASVVEPGTFPKDYDEDFSTPGMLLFTQLPGARDGLAIYSDMLFTAERLATLLDADLHDETHSKLTKQSIEHTRQGILEHRRQLQLLRSRR